ncbi:hypothetical protein ABZP36_004548 [Zizania latifolia]
MVQDASQVRSPTVSSEEFMRFKRKATTIVEEYFSKDNVTATANELRELRVPCYHYYFVKKLISVAMDRHDREKEMAVVLLSSLYGDVIDRLQVYKGFGKLTESCDDLSVDTPDAVDILAVFVARAIIDDILPPAFLENKSITVEEAKAKIDGILEEYLSTGDRGEASRCIRGLKIPFFYHDIVKHALILAIEHGAAAEGHILDLLKLTSDKGIINESQITKGFNRLIDSVDDLTLDVPNARRLLKSIILKASSEGWLCASSLKPLGPEQKKAVVEDDTAVWQFKAKATSIIQEYFLTGDIIEVVSHLEAENYTCSF